MKRWFWNCLIGIDQFGNALFGPLLNLLLQPSGATTALHSLVLPTRAPCRTCRITFLTMFDSALLGYSVLEVNPYGVV